MFRFHHASRSGFVAYAYPFHRLGCQRKTPAFRFLWLTGLTRLMCLFFQLPLSLFLPCFIGKRFHPFIIPISYHFRPNVLCSSPFHTLPGSGSHLGCSIAALFDIGKAFKKRRDRKPNSPAPATEFFRTLSKWLPAIRMNHLK